MSDVLFFSGAYRCGKKSVVLKSKLRDTWWLSLVAVKSSCCNNLVIMLSILIIPGKFFISGDGTLYIGPDRTLDMP